MLFLSLQSKKTKKNYLSFKLVALRILKNKMSFKATVSRLHRYPCHRSKSNTANSK